ncbi:glycoside hydrolase family 97 protein [[Flexibacter] sp. ATCC 35208]|uniref:glycoside hydrolase family 97 protein n=1 Tax=[Flexibacter] sp. ATCC 35208 TaxID=1936242 RepID=UPI0009C453ED|nr:glycoside hydrolase family 97 protein [[Flexibacter] sp. ATCC 35208]OMP77392.1 glycoside hydrolase family 97 [[Flexibacter] sp. ATCC 35208]
MRYLKQGLLTLLMWGICTTTVNANKQGNEIQVNSPNKQISVHVFIENERLSYSILYGNVKVINTSPLGLTVDHIDLGYKTTMPGKPEVSSLNERYSIFGNHSLVTNHANETSIPLEAAGKKFNLIIRVYDDGVAIRYTIPIGTRHIDSESTSWNLPENTTNIAWSGFSQSYEELSHVTSLNKVPENQPIMGPLTFEVSGRYLSISEADCETFSDMSFIRNGHVLKAYFPFAKDGWQFEHLAENGPSVPDGSYKGQKVTPWRTTIISPNLNGLVNADLLMNVCPPPKEGRDFSWVKPGRCLWQWWSVGAPQLEDQKNWYDAAAKLKWEYYLVDDGWRDWRKDGKDQWTLLKEVIDYGKSVGVQSIVWVDSKECRNALERHKYLEKIKVIGASGIKIDFIPDATADIMQWYVGTMEDCAELKLLLNFHGSVKPTGLRRTYPNDITREAVRGNEYHMSRYDRVMPFQQDVCLPFTRLMAGAADITPVILNPAELTTAKYTWAHEFAQAIVYLSPVTHFCDQYKFYLDSPMFDLFQTIPTTWDETRVLPCTQMGEVVAFARRKGDTWWIGIMNGTTEREVKIPLSFLSKKTKATLVYDTLTNTSINRETKFLSPKDVLTIRLAPGGGFTAKM